MSVQAASSGVRMLHTTAVRSSATLFPTMMAGISKVILPAVQSDPKCTFYRSLQFTDDRLKQEKLKAIQHFDKQFGLDFSTIESNELGQQFLGNAMIHFNVGYKAVYNRWIASGNTTSKSFTVAGGGFEVGFSGDMMLHGIYGGEEGKIVHAGDGLVHGYMAIYDERVQQPTVFQCQTNVPGRMLPVEGSLVEEFQLYNHNLGKGRVQTIWKISPLPDNQTSLQYEFQQVFQFP